VFFANFLSLSRQNLQVGLSPPPYKLPHTLHPLAHLIRYYIMGFLQQLIVRFAALCIGNVVFSDKSISFWKYLVTYDLKSLNEHNDTARIIMSET